MFDGLVKKMRNELSEKIDEAEERNKIVGRLKKEMEELKRKVKLKEKNGEKRMKCV